MKIIAPKQLMENQAPIIRNGGIFSRASLDLQFARTRTLDPRVTHTRQSSATYVDGDGVIRTAVTNLLLQSEDFSTTWNADGVCTVDPDQILSPIGTLTADKITVDASGPNRVSQTITVSAGNTYILSAYVKTLDINKINIRFFLSGSDAYADYVFADNSFFVTNSLNLTQTGYIPLTDGWTRIYLRYEPNVGGNLSIRFGGGVSGDSTNGSFYLWGAQLEESSTVGQYVKTTTAKNGAPRFDHDPTTGESLGLLVEESSVNYFEWSNSATYGETWNNVGVLLNLASGQADPAGGTTAIRASDADNTTGGTFLQRTNLASLTTGETVSYSIWLKPISCPNNTIVLFLYANGTTDFVSATFGVSDQQITGVNNTSSGGTGSVGNASVIPYPNGWYRCILTGIPSTVTMTDVRARTNLAAYQRVQGTARFDWYGAQLEAGSFPTSYIPTSGSPVTRAADVASITGTNFSSWYNDSEGTMFADSARTSVVPTADFPQVFYFSDGTADNSINIGYLTASFSQFRVRTAGTNEANLLPSNSNLRRIVAGCYRVNDAAMSDGGGAVSVSGTPVTLPSGINKVTIGGSQVSANPLNGTIRRLTYWPTRLSNDTLQTITQ